MTALFEALHLRKRYGDATVVDDVSFAIAPGAVATDYQARSQAIQVTGAPSGCEGGAWSATESLTWLTAAQTGPRSAVVSWTARRLLAVVSWPAVAASGVKIRCVEIWGSRKRSG